MSLFLSLTHTLFLIHTHILSSSLSFSYTISLYIFLTHKHSHTLSQSHSHSFFLSITHIHTHSYTQSPLTHNLTYFLYYLKSSFFARVLSCFCYLIMVGFILCYFFIPHKSWLTLTAKIIFKLIVIHKNQSWPLKNVLRPIRESIVLFKSAKRQFIRYKHILIIKSNWSKILRSTEKSHKRL